MLTKEEALEKTIVVRKQLLEKARNGVHNLIEITVNKGESSKSFSMNEWFKNIDRSDVEVFVKELKDNGYSVNLTDKWLDVNWS